MDQICFHNDTEKRPQNSLIVQANKFIIVPVQIIRKMPTQAHNTIFKRTQCNPGTSNYVHVCWRHRYSEPFEMPN